MAWNPDFFSDGQQANLLLNTTLTNARTYVNDLDRLALRRGAFNVDMTPSIIPSGGNLVVNHSPAGANLHSYLAGTFLGSYNYTTYGADGGSTNGGDLGTGDRFLLGHPSQAGAAAAPACSITFPASGYKLANNSNSGVQGILLNANIEIADVQDANANIRVMFCFQFKIDTSATWWTIRVSERFVSRDDHKISATDTNEYMWYDVPLASLLTASVLQAESGADPTAVFVTGARVMLSVVNANAVSGVFLNRFRFSALPFLSSLA